MRKAATLLGAFIIISFVFSMGRSLVTGAFMSPSVLELPFESERALNGVTVCTQGAVDNVSGVVLTLRRGFNEHYYLGIGRYSASKEDIVYASFIDDKEARNTIILEGADWRKTYETSHGDVKGPFKDAPFEYAESASIRFTEASQLDFITSGDITKAVMVSGDTKRDVPFSKALISPLSSFVASCEALQSVGSE